jgi:predicted helicase
MVGVSITFLVKRQNLTNQTLKGFKNRSGLSKPVKYFSTLDNNLISRAEKLSFLENANFSKIKWEKLRPAQTPYFWFTHKDLSLGVEYKKFWKLTDIFEHYNSGIETKRDEFTLHYSKENLEKLKEQVKNLSVDTIKKQYDVADGRDWKVVKAIEDLLLNFNPQKISYRPFDNRFSSLSQKSKGFIAYPRYKTSQHFEKENIGLCFTRNIDKDVFSDVLITEKPIDTHYTSGQNYVAPLYYYNGHKANGVFEIEFDDNCVKSDNFTQKFIKNYLQKLPFKPTPEKILAYIYAVLHSSTYRTKYIEFLKTDFPAVPMTANKEIFKKYAALGQRLIDLHLLKKLPDDTKITFSLIGVENDFVIEKIEQSGDQLFLKVLGGKTITISGVTEKIYNFEIGSYRPIDKWLKYRIKDHVSLDVSDLNHLKNMIISIKGTIAVVQDIEKQGEAYLQ